MTLLGVLDRPHRLAWTLDTPRARSTPRMMSTERSAVVVRPLTTREVGAYAALHRLVFPQYSSSKLGSKFCRRFYASYSTTPVAFGFGVWQGNHLLGFFIAAPESVARQIRKRYLFVALWPVLYDPIC